MGGYSVGPSRALRGQGRPPVGRMRSAPRHAEGTAVPATRCCWSTLACRVRGRGQGEGGRKTAAAAAALRTVCRRCRRCRPREEGGKGSKEQGERGDDIFFEKRLKGEGAEFEKIVIIGLPNMGLC